MLHTILVQGDCIARLQYNSNGIHVAGIICSNPRMSVQIAFFVHSYNSKGGEFEEAGYLLVMVFGAQGLSVL